MIIETSAGFGNHRRGQRIPSLIKQKMELGWNLLPPFLSKEPGPALLCVHPRRDPHTANEY
jgi:hypothetical protein